VLEDHVILRDDPVGCSLTFAVTGVEVPTEPSPGILVEAVGVATE
jgi:hypothetical protein